MLTGPQTWLSLEAAFKMSYQPLSAGAEGLQRLWRTADFQWETLAAWKHCCSAPGGLAPHFELNHWLCSCSRWRRPPPYTHHQWPHQTHSGSGWPEQPVQMHEKVNLHKDARATVMRHLPDGTTVPWFQTLWLGSLHWRDLGKSRRLVSAVRPALRKSCS